MYHQTHPWLCSDKLGLVIDLAVIYPWNDITTDDIIDDIISTH